MSSKWKTPIRCPECGSSSVRKREVVHKSGTSIYSGGSHGSGLSFGLSGRKGTRAWFGSGSHYGSRQSIFAREAAPLSVFAPIFIGVLILGVIIDGGYQQIWYWIGLIFCLWWLWAAIKDIPRYQNEWICGKCGTSFMPELIVSGKDAIQTEQKNLDNLQVMDSPNNEASTGKTCSICGKWFANSEFIYGNRENRSYCQRCNQEEKKAYSHGGAEAARKFREDMRSKWKMD